MTFPTVLTVLRIPLTFVIMGLVFVPGWPAKAAALICFVLAGLTDWLDGYLARRLSRTSPLGALLDPIADKVLVLGIFLAFVQRELIPAWMVLLIACREFLITSVRLYAASRAIVLPAAMEGKHKTVSQLVTIFVILSVLIVRDATGAWAREPLVESVSQWGILGCLWLTTVLTLASGTSFFLRHWRVLRDTVGR